MFATNIVSLEPIIVAVVDTGDAFMCSSSVSDSFVSISMWHHFERNAEMIVITMLTTHTEAISSHDLRYEIREWYRNGSVTAHHVSPTTNTTDSTPVTIK